MHALLPGHNTVHQVYFPCESIPKILYRWRKLEHKKAGLAASEDFTSLCLQFTTTCAIFKAVNLIMIIRYVRAHGRQS